jgi:membrane-bound serine protease (ClpP class)
METVVTLILVGAALLLLETVLPGMIAGILGILCLVAGVIMGYATFGMRTGNMILFAVGLGLVIGTLYWIKYFPNSSMARVFVSQQTIGDLGVEKPELLNQTGMAHTNLRPSGTAVINGQRIDVVTEGALIERGTPIKVVAVEGMRVVVRAA